MPNTFWVIDSTGRPVDIVDGRNAALRRVDALQHQTRQPFTIRPA